MKNSINIFNALNESLEAEFEAKRKAKLNESPVLEPRYDSRKSFYGKAKVEDDKLYSYNTLVAEIKDGKPVVYGLYSQTTARHIKEWLRQNGFKAESSKQIMNDYGVKEESAPVEDTTETSQPLEDNKMEEIVEEVVEEIVEETVNEAEVVTIQNTQTEPDYIISDVTVLDTVGDGDVQSPDIDALLTLIDESLKSEYSNEWGRIKTLSSSKNEAYSYALVDISTPEILKEFEEKGIEDAAIGKNLILESLPLGMFKFKVNNLNGITKYSKVTDNPQQAIYEWVESEFLHEAKEEKVKELEILKAKTEKETIENYIENRIDLRQEIENIKMFIELGKQVKASEEMKPAIQKRMYAFAAEMPHNIEVSNKKDKYELSFGSLDKTVEIIFGKQWVKEVEEIPEVVELKENYSLKDKSGVIHNEKELRDTWEKELKDTLEPNETLEQRKKDSSFEKYIQDLLDTNDFELVESQKMNEAYEQFNIGDIEVVFNPETYECLYSIPSAEVKDKKVNLTKVPSVDTPYDTNTIIKSYIETRFGVLPSEEEKKMIDQGEVSAPKQELPAEVPADDVEVPVDLDGELQEDELPEEPTEGEPTSEIPVEDELPTSETGNAIFMKIRPKQPTNIESLRQRTFDGDTPESNYIVVDNIDLNDEDWNDLTSDLTKQQSYLSGIQPIDRKNYSFNVVKLTNAESNFDLLVDPLGYNYPRYIAIVDKQVQ